MELSSYVFSPLRKEDFTLYRGSGNGLDPILLVVPVEESAAHESQRRIEHEYNLKAALESDWAARPVALVRRNDRTALVLADPGGEPLDRLLGRSMDVTEFLRVAASIALALRKMHAQGLIHKDVKPANILVDMASARVRLTGFGIASRLPRERQVPTPPEMIAGTLAYMAPEQTGRMNRSIDSRSDLYALGVTFYEMLTGLLPFTASDPMEWVHCHIARQPVAPHEHEKEIPALLSAIVLKLLAKAAEERYQTAAGVEADLCRCLVEWQSHGRVDSFPLGMSDVSDRLRIPEKLYGREREIDSLLASFNRVVAQGTPELVLVSGYSGIGKSSVVNELHKMLVPPRGLFAAGKFDQYKRDIPYTTLAQAFQALVRQILVKSDIEMDRWRTALTESVGPNGQLIVNLVPEVEFIIGKQPPVPDLPPQDAQNRFQLVFRRFIGAFAKPEHPLALFLDDLQWLDAATLDLLEHLITHSEVRHLLLVGAYRDNEIGPTHPLLRTLEAIRGVGSRVHEIVLAPLGHEDITRLITDAVFCAPERAQPLAQLVREKTNGNPFFAIQFFTALAEEGLLAFDPVKRGWQWDIDRISARSYTDNVVDLVAGKLKRFSATTQEVLVRLACLGNVAQVSTLALLCGDREEEMHAALWEAVRAGLVSHQESSCKFLHDRIQQAAYSLIPAEHRADVHLQIGRVMLAGMAADQLAERLFDVANQLNRGAALLVDRDEKAQVATIDLRAGRKAKASAAYASARSYFSAGMALLDEKNWESHYALTFSLWLERVECEYLSGEFAEAEQLITELLRRGASKLDQAAVYHLKVQLHILESENQQAVDSALACLRMFGINLPAHPTWDQVQGEYEKVWQTIAGRPIEGLIDLPMMTDPELQAAMQVLAVLISPAYFTDFNLYCLHICRMVNVSMQHGTSGASAHAYGYLGFILGPIFHRYRDALRFAKVACDLVERQDFNAGRAKVYYAIGTVAFWTQPIARAIDLMREGFRTATETGDMAFACYCMVQSVTGLLLRNDPIDSVWRQSEIALGYIREAKYGDWMDIIVSQQRFIATMQGRTASFSTFSDAQFDESRFEVGLTDDRMKLMVSWYWILKLKARFLSGDYADALAAAGKVKPLLPAAAAQIQLLDYYYYMALTVAVSYEHASTDEQREWRELLTAHQEQLREWAENYPPTFGDKHALVCAEIARLEYRDLDAMRLYEQAIRLARDHGFVHNEGLAHEIAARFYAARGFATIADAYLRNARYCYLRWGADGKVRQLERSHPELREDHARLRSTATIGAPVSHLDVATVVKASQALSSEMDLRKVIETLMRITVEHAGAERGLFILFSADEPQIEAEAICTHRIEVNVRQARVTPSDLPLSALHYVTRTQKRMVLDDASASGTYSEDEYVRHKGPRSVLCLPIVKQTKLVGALYLENNLAPCVFTSDRIAVLELLASQAAISLEHARLYTDLQLENSERKRAEDGLRKSGTALKRSEGILKETQRLSSTGSFSWCVATGEFMWSDEVYRIFEFDEGVPATLELMTTRIHPEDIPSFYDMIDQARDDGCDFEYEHRLLMHNQSVKYLHLVAHATRNQDGQLEYIGAVQDVTQRRLSEEALSKARSDLAHVARVTSLGALTASIAHEVNQPLSGIITNANTCLRMLAADPPNIEGARETVRRAIRDGNRASDVITRLRALFAKKQATFESVDLNEVTREVIALSLSDIQRSRVILRPELTEALPPVAGDRVQLQQVILNLLRNASDAMSGVEDRPRQVVIRTAQDEGDRVRLTVQDSGVGIEPQDVDRLFEPFYTTKTGGMGIGLSVSRSIIESHRGRLWVVPNEGPGVTFAFSIPREPEREAGAHKSFRV
jgi:predicted ATPase/signal transduction histidine kinase